MRQFKRPKKGIKKGEKINKWSFPRIPDEKVFKTVSYRFVKRSSKSY